jgi:phage FluMu gp28-like protein
VTLPTVFLPYQQEWLKDGSRVRVAEKSRRIGISWTSAAELALDAASINGCDGWYIGYNKDMAQEYIRDVAWWSKQLCTVASNVEESVFIDEDKEILTFCVRYASGFKVTALSSRPSNLRNKRGHIVIDEAAHHPDLQGLLKAALAILMWGGKARVDLISSHNGVESYFNQVLVDVRAGKRPYGVHRTTIDDALEQGLLKRICLVNGWEWTPAFEREWREDIFSQYGDGADEELLCVPSRSGGTYLHRGLIERAMVDGPVVVRWTPPEGFMSWSEVARTAHVEAWCQEALLGLLARLPTNLLHFFGEDFGRTSDRTVIAIGHLTQGLKRRVPLVIELLNVPFEHQKQILFFALDRVPKLTAGQLDATGNGAYLAEVAALKYGASRVIEVKLTDGWYAEHLPRLKNAFEEDRLELARDADHLVDLSALKVINGLPKLPAAKTKSVDGHAPPRHGDAAIAYALLYAASEQPITDYEGYEGTSSRKSLVVLQRQRKVAGFKRPGGGLL